MSPSPNDEGSFLAYAKKAFLLPWNVMIFGGACVGALFSPQPDAFLALLAGVEVVYLGALTSLPRFRLAVDAERHGTQEAVAETPALEDVVRKLPAESSLRFERLLYRCRQMRKLASDLQGERGNAAREVAGDLRTTSLDQLLWGFLRLLQHYAALGKLLQTMNEGEMRARLEDIKAGLARAKAANDERLTHSFEERLGTAQSRLEFLARTHSDAVFVEAELDRIEDKIQALSEMAVNQHDPDALSAEIDAAAASMQSTESAISQLQTVTGLASSIGAAPSILDAPRVRGTNTA